MKMMKLFMAFLSFGFCCAWAQAEEKTVGQKTEEVWDKTKQKTKQVSNAVVKETKETIQAIEHKIDAPDADARKVKVTLTDGGVQMPRSLPAGKTAFIVVNTGKQKHNFAIEGEHLDKSFWFAIDPKNSKTMQVALKPGSYEAHCSIDEHAKKEARVKLAVK